MRRTAALTALLLALWPVAVWPACAGRDLLAAMKPDRRAETLARAAGVPYPEGNLWRAERNGAVVHLAGTLHVGDPRLGPVMARLSPLIEGAALVLVESTPEAQADLRATLATRPELAFLTGPQGLRDRLGAADAAAFDVAMTARGVHPSLADRYRPWLALATLSVPPCLLAAGTPAPGLDAQVIDHAARAGVPVAPIKAHRFAVHHLDALDEGDALELLRLSLRRDAVAEDLLHTMTEAYFAGRHRLAWELPRSWPPQATDRPALHDRLEKALLRRRNRAWVRRIEDASPRGPLFVAVGAAHLSGHDGLLDLLARAGWRLRRLEPTDPG